jgi:hypothetical protein
MSLIAGVLAFSGGEVVTTTSPPDSFNGGTPTLNDGSLCVVDDGNTPPTYVAGLGYDAQGRLHIDTSNTPSFWVAGLPVTALGKLCARGSGTIDSYVAGIPLAGGYVRASTGGIPDGVIVQDNGDYVVDQAGNYITVT